MVLAKLVLYVAGSSLSSCSRTFMERFSPPPPSSPGSFGRSRRASLFLESLLLPAAECPSWPAPVHTDCYILGIRQCTLWPPERMTLNLVSYTFVRSKAQNNVQVPKQDVSRATRPPEAPAPGENPYPVPSSSQRRRPRPPALSSVFKASASILLQGSHFLLGPCPVCTVPPLQGRLWSQLGPPR